MNIDWAKRIYQLSLTLLRLVITDNFHALAPVPVPVSVSKVKTIIHHDL